VSKMHKPISYSRVGFVAALIGLCACTVGPKYHPPVTQAPPVYKESPKQFKETGDWTVADPQDAMLRGKWWEIFKEPELNRLEEKLNIDNQNIKQFFESFMEARALIREARAQYYPTVTFAPTWNRAFSPGSLSGAASGANGVVTAGGHTATFMSSPIDVSWAPDLWGRVRNLVRQNQYAAQLSAADLENERLTEQASLAEFYFEIRGQDELQRVLNQTVEADKKSLELARARYETGVDTMISVVQAQATLESVHAAAINVGLARAQFEHAIAVLIGSSPSEFSIPVKPMTTAPPPIPIGVPSQLLERRPDIAAAERSMAEANAQIGIAKAAYFPTLTLTATGGVESSAFNTLIGWSSRFWAIGGTLSETVFDGGLRRATVHQFVAAYNASLAGYRQTVLTAFQQVEDSLAGVRILSHQVIELKRAVDSAGTALKLELGRFETGIDPYVDVVIAQTTLLSNQQALVTTQVTEMTAAVQLIMALGGGWDRSQLPTPEQVAKKPAKSETKIQH
jgi:NodT family efflux transporter outer membrane factor (OMF) lipoprotein